MSVSYRVWNNADEVTKANWVVSDEDLFVSTEDTTVLGTSVSTQDNKSNGTRVVYTFFDTTSRVKEPVFNTGISTIA